MNNTDFLSDIRKENIENTKYFRLYNGRVVTLQDSKVLCTIDALGMDTPDKGVICTYSDKNSLKSLQIGDIVIIAFINGDRNNAYVIGTANNFQNMPPTSYNFQSQIDTLYEDRKSFVKINQDFLKFIFSVVAVAGWTISLEQETGKTISLDNLKIKIATNAQSIEIDEAQIKLNSGTESFVKGDTFRTALQTYLTIISQITPGNAAQNAAALNAIKAGATTFLAQLNNILSTTIKGE